MTVHSLHAIAAGLGKVIRRAMEHPFENFDPIPGR